MEWLIKKTAAYKNLETKKTLELEAVLTEANKRLQEIYIRVIINRPGDYNLHMTVDKQGRLEPQFRRVR